MYEASSCRDDVRVKLQICRRDEVRVILQVCQQLELPNLQRNVSFEVIVTKQPGEK